MPFIHSNASITCTGRYIHIGRVAFRAIVLQLLIRFARLTHLLESGCDGRISSNRGLECVLVHFVIEIVANRLEHSLEEFAGVTGNRGELLAWLNVVNSEFGYNSIHRCIPIAVELTTSDTDEIPSHTLQNRLSLHVRDNLPLG